jgi:hypothetical protein
MRIPTAALATAPYDPDLLFGPAHFSSTVGAPDVALRCPRLLTEFDPDNPAYQELSAKLVAAQTP